MGKQPTHAPVPIHRGKGARWLVLKNRENITRTEQRESLEELLEAGRAHLREQLGHRQTKSREPRNRKTEAGRRSCGGQRRASHRRSAP